MRRSSRSLPWMINNRPLRGPFFLLYTMKEALITFLKGLIALLEGSPKQEPSRVRDFSLRGEDHELILQFLNSTHLTHADLSQP